MLNVLHVRVHCCHWTASLRINKLSCKYFPSNNIVFDYCIYFARDC